MSTRTAKCRKKRGYSSSITVYLALCFALIASLLLTITEVARGQGDRLMMQTALNAGMESLFSQFHRPLWENYRLLGLEYRDDENLKKELFLFMKPYFEAKDLFPITLAEEDLSFSDKLHLTEKRAFEESVLDYMRFGWTKAIFPFMGEKRSIEETLPLLSPYQEKSKEQKNLAPLLKKYQFKHKDIEKLEDALAAIDDRCQDLKKQHQKALSCLEHENPDGFYQNAGACGSVLSSFSPLMAQYREALQRLQEALSELQAHYELDKEKIGEDGRTLLSSQLREYENYLSSQSAVQLEIDQIPEKASQLQTQISEEIARVEEFEAWLSEARENASDDTEEEADFSEEIHDFYRAAGSRFRALPLITVTMPISRIHKKEKNKLDAILSMKNTGLLSLVLPGGTELPSEQALMTGDPHYPSESRLNPLESAAMGQYFLQYFHHYHDSSHKNEDVPPSRSEDFEIEYLLAGKTSNRDNLSSVVTELLLIRKAANLIYLFSDAEKVAEARSFAVTVLAATANPVLISVLSFFVLSVWALGQAILDLRELLSGYRIPPMHSRESFSLSLSHLSGIAQKQLPEGKHRDRGFSYQDYLRILLFLHGQLAQSGINQRALSRIQADLEALKKQPAGTFRIDHCLFAASGRSRMRSRRILITLPIVSMVSGSRDDFLEEMELKSDYSYRNEMQ